VAKSFVIVTGDKALDAKLKSLPPNLQKKLTRGALRKGAKRLTLEFKRRVRLVAYDTGAFHDSTKIKALKRSRTRIGVSMFTNTEKLFAKYESKHGHKPNPRKGESRPFFYPATIELGDIDSEPKKPMRGALYDNSEVFKAYFAGDLKQFIAENKVSTALPKVIKGSRL
jgi:hypothetical protein